MFLDWQILCWILISFMVSLWDCSGTTTFQIVFYTLGHPTDCEITIRIRPVASGLKFKIKGVRIYVFSELHEGKI